MFIYVLKLLGFQNWKKHTALTVASRNGHTLTVKVLLEHEAAVDYQNEVCIASDNVTVVLSDIVNRL